MKPLLNVARTEDELRQKEEELNKLREKVLRDDANRKEIEEQQTQLMEEKNQLFIQLQRVSVPSISLVNFFLLEGILSAFFKLGNPLLHHFFENGNFRNRSSVLKQRRMSSG